MAKIEFSSNFKAVNIVAENLDELERKLDPILQIEKTLLVKRTTEGKDPDLKVFKKYRPSTIAAKEKKGKQTAPPNLTDTGNMLQSITTSVEKIGNQVIGRIFSIGFSDRIRHNEELGRTFLGLDKNQRLRLKEKIANLIKG